MTIRWAEVGDAALLATDGVLDTSTYLALRDNIIGAALTDPRAVIVDVTRLEVPAESAWTVFTSAQWHVGAWPDTPIMLVCEDPALRASIGRSGVSQHIPVHPSVGAAVATVTTTDGERLRAQADLPADLVSLPWSRELVEQWLTEWSQPDLIPVGKVIMTALVENVLRHTDAAPRVRVEYDGVAVTVAVTDDSHAAASISETLPARDAPSGLRIVNALSRTWGNAPTPSGKTVWAVLGPENRL